MPLLAALFIGAAGAVQESEQVLLDGDKASFEPVSTELVEINGVPTLTKTFRTVTGDRPVLARARNRFHRTATGTVISGWKRPTRDDRHAAGRGNGHSRRASGELADVIGQFPSDTTIQQRRLYRRTAAGRAEHSGGGDRIQHGHGRPPTYRHQNVCELAYNDRSLVPETVQADGLTLPLTGLSWSETKNVEDSDVPAVWTATATYSKTTYTTREVADGYRATAVYKGEVGKTSVGSVVYTVTYTGNKIPVLPGWIRTLQCIAGRDRDRAGSPVPAGGSALVSRVGILSGIYVSLTRNAASMTS